MKEITQGRVDARLGLGFLIISEGTVNLGLWGGKSSALLNQTVYEFDPAAKPLERTYTAQSLDQAGTFCCWELGIVAHEGAAWRSFLQTKRTPADVDNYLHDCYKGIVR